MRFNRTQECETVSTPESTLIAAVLRRAYCDLDPTISDEDRRDAVAWFTGREDAQISFRVCIDVLNLGSWAVKLIMSKVYEAESLYGNKSVLEGQKSGEGDCPVVEGERLPLGKKVTAI